MTTKEKSYPYAAAGLAKGLPYVHEYAVFDNSAENWYEPLAYPDHVVYSDEAEAHAVADRMNLDLGPGVAEKLYAEALAANGGK
jgi:hypothetical protein